MIYTVTYNPAIDYVVRMDEIIPGAVNRTRGEEVFYGGKGINVSVVMRNMGVENTALGFIAGFTGDAIEKYLTKLGIKTDFIKLNAGISRINVKIKAGEETEINGQGPEISDEDIMALMDKIDGLSAGDTLILAGSVPKSLPDDIYERIMSRLEGKGVEIVVDATGNLLVNVLKYRPFLIKPNNHELSEIFGIEIKTEDELIEYAKKLQDKGARNVLISRAGDGAILVPEKGEPLKSGAPKGKVVNSVGSGDSMVAGFVMGYMKSGDYGEALKLGTACGSATAFSPGLAEKDLVDELLKTL